MNLNLEDLKDLNLNDFFKFPVDSSGQLIEQSVDAMTMTTSIFYVCQFKGKSPHQSRAILVRMFAEFEKAIIGGDDDYLICNNYLCQQIREQEAFNVLFDALRGE